MEIIFCLSYLEVADAITIIERSAGDYLVVTSNKNIYNYFSFVFDQTRILLLNKEPLAFSRSPIKMINCIRRLNAEKRKTWKMFAKYEGCNVYFFCVAFCELEAWVVKRLTIKNKVFYKPEVDMTCHKVKYKFKSIGIMILIWFLYGIKVNPIWVDCRFFYSVAKYFVKNEIISKYNSEINKDAVNKVLDIEIGAREILLLAGNDVGDGFVEKEEYMTKMDELIDFLIDRFGKDRIAIKPHHSVDILYSQRERELYCIPKYLPGILVYPFVKYVIGYVSLGLSEAASEGKISISLLRYMASRQEHEMGDWKRNMDNNALNPILYPESISMIASIIDKVEDEENKVIARER